MNPQTESLIRQAAENADGLARQARYDNDMTRAEFYTGKAAGLRCALNIVWKEEAKQKVGEGS